MEKFKEYLRKIAPISDSDFADTLTYFKNQEIKKGHVWVKLHDICKNVGFMITGTIRIYYINKKGEEITYGFCQNCFTTSFKSFIFQTPSELMLEAIEDTTLLVIDFDSLNKLYDNYPIWQKIGRIIVQNEFIIMEQYASVLNNETAKEKYLRLLEEQPNILHIAKIEDIATYLGVTRRTLSRIRKEISK